MKGPAFATGLICCLTGPALAQVTGHLDLGLGSASMPGAGMTSLWAAAPTLRLETRNLRLEGSGEYRDLGPAGRDLSGFASASYFVRLPGPLLLEAGGGGAVRGAAGLATASSWDVGGRLHLRAAVAGGWLGLRGGRDRFGGLRSWEAGLWRDMGAVSFQIQGRQTTSGDITGPPIAARDSLSRPDSGSQSRVRLTTELGGWLTWNQGPLQLRGGAGWRLSNLEPVRSGALADGTASLVRSSTSWWIAEGTYWLTERLGLTGAVGRQSPNPSLLVTATNFMRLSVRVGLDRHPSERKIPPHPDAGLTLRRMGERVQLEFEAPLARGVEVMGDLTDWQPVAMKHEGGNRWRIQLAATPGIHYLNVRYDGGAWQTPPSLRVVQDEFGKETGLLLVQ
ncbi:MAG: glycogen-binding domain-containing protein [Gemmatimonadota bacterium]